MMMKHLAGYMVTVSSFECVRFDFYGCCVGCTPGNPVVFMALGYHDQVTKDKKGHKLGSPHIHIATAVFEGLAKMSKDVQELKLQHIFLTMVCQFLENGGPKTIDELVPFMRLKDLSAGKNSKGGKKKNGKGRGKTQSSDEEEPVAAKMDTTGDQSDHLVADVPVEPDGGLDGDRQRLLGTEILWIAV